MSPFTRRIGAVFALLALLMIAALAGCEQGANGTGQKATATSGPRATSTTRPGGTPGANGTPPSGGTPTPTAACDGKLSDIILPDHAVQVGPTGTAGATTSCAYRISQDLNTLNAFFKTQMSKQKWRLLHVSAEGPLGLVQEYFKGQRFATITLTQHEADTHTTDVTISVEASQ